MCWGQNAGGQLGDTTNTVRATPMPVMGLAGLIQQIAAGTDFNCALTGAGMVYCWGRNNAGQLGVATSEQCVTSGGCSTTAIATTWLSPSPATQIDAGGLHTCAIDGDRKLWCWGQNDNGQVGLPPALPDVETPVDTGLGSVAEVSTGETHTCARMDDNTLWCWGSNAMGELGIGPGSDAPPMEVTEHCPQFRG